MQQKARELMSVFLIVMVAVLFCCVVNGYHRGMVKSVISFISLIFLSIFAILLGSGLVGYMKGNYLKMAVVAFLLCVVGIVHHIFGVVILPAKLVSKLPVIKSGDKLLGIVVGVLESVLILWTVYAFLMQFEIGGLGTTILNGTAQNPVLTWLYENNYLVKAMQTFGTKIPDVKLPDIKIDFLKK